MFFMFFFRAMIPRGENEFGVSHCEIVREYIMQLKLCLPNLKPHDPLFYRGNPSAGNKASKFVNQQMGDKYLKAVPREICEFLGLPNPEKFRSHSMRHTAAEIAAQNGASVPQLMVSRFYNHYVFDNYYLSNSFCSFAYCKDLS